ncbi:MCE family protein [Aeromicrobium sp. A1-2]|uniref:MCE family protein n=1 Tax=Aeromicrobium sp. A1-2 TaxID=2107713 RepID=UPI0013C36A16|nr:MlaD family protein [Aeromicrobium sp. A1-2]
MITRQTKIQLLVFLAVTVLGGAFVGGRYAQIDRLVVDRTYAVDAHFSDSGGIFEGAQVTYRGIEVGRVGLLEFEPSGVRVRLDIENNAPSIPSDVEVAVATKSAIGEQFVDLRPRASGKPYLTDGSEVALADTRIPIDTTTLLVDVNDLVTSVDTDNLRTVVDELGQAFDGTGEDLATILDTSSEFIEAADDNIGVTRSLIRESDSVLQTQIDKESAIGSFSENLALLSDSLVDADPDLRRLLDQGSDSAQTLRTVVDENSEDLGSIIDDLQTINRPIAENLIGIQTLFVIYPTVVQSTFSVLNPTGTGDYNAGFGLALTDLTPTCTYANSGGAASGYQPRREEAVISDRELRPGTDCNVENSIARQASKTVYNRPAASSDPSWATLLIGPATH